MGVWLFYFSYFKEQHYLLNSMVQYVIFVCVPTVVGGAICHIFYCLRSSRQPHDRQLVDYNDIEQQIIV